MEDQVKCTVKCESKPLQNFTIPKIKRSSGKACLVRCITSRREYSDIQNILNEARLNVADEVNNCYKYGDAKMVINSDLEKSFLQKRSEVRELGRHGRELEVNFCFLVLPYNSAIDICQQGLKVNNTPSNLLGNPLMGVYLFRHIDVALASSKQKNDKSDTVLVFKVLFGKVKKVQPNVTLNKPALDPTPNSDSHMSKKAPALNDPFDEQVANSLVYLYEYDTNFKAVEKPRHCLPYVLLPVTYLGLPVTGKSLTPLKVNQKLFSAEKDTLINCTVAKRIGKGKNATVIYENIRAPVVKTSHLTKESSPYLAMPCPPKQPRLCRTEQSLGNMLPSTFQNIVTAPANHMPQQYGTQERYSAFSKSAADLESLISSSLVITSKTNRDPRLHKRNEPDVSKPDDQCLISQMTPQYLKSANEFSHCSVDEFHHSCEDIIGKTKFLYLSFEEKRIFDQQLKNKGKKISSLLEPCDSDKKAKEQYFLKKCSDENSDIIQQTLICSKSSQNNTKVCLADTVECLPINSSWEGDVSGTIENTSGLVTNAKYEGIDQKQSVDCDNQQKGEIISFVKGDVYTHVTKVTSLEIRHKHTETRKGNSSTSHGDYDVKNSVVCNKRTDTLISTEEKSPDINNCNSTKAKMLPNNTLNQQNGRNNCSITGDTKKIAHEHESIKALLKYGGSDTKKKETRGQYHSSAHRTENSATLDCIVNGSSECTLTNKIERKLCLDKLSIDHNERSNKISKQISTDNKQRDCGTSSSLNRLSDYTGLNKKSILLARQRTDKILGCSSTTQNTKEINKKETEMLLNPEKQQLSNPVAQRMHETENPLQDRSTKMQETTLIHRQKLPKVYKTGSPTMEEKGDIFQTTSMMVVSPKPVQPVEGTLSMIQNLNHKSRMTKIHDTYVNNESNISSEVQVNFSCDSQTKSTFHDNGKVTPPCKVDMSLCNADLLLKPVQTKLLGSIMPAPLQDNDALVVNCTEVDKNQNFGMTAEELSCIQYLGTRIDWKSLFGMETSEILSEEMKHCKLSKGGTQLYQYKAKTEKEPGGLRIFPDMQITITNNCKSFENSESIHSIYSNTPIELQTFEKKISEYKNDEPSDDQMTDGHVQVSNKVSIQSPKGYKSRPNRISNKVHQVQLSTEETIQPKTNNEPVGKEITSKRRAKFNRKLAHIASEYKHSDNTLKQQRLNNKNVHRLVFKASAGRIKKFSLSEENIKSVLSMLSDEATLCKSKRISKKLDRAILHLRKAHKRVQKSLQLVKRRNTTNPQNGGVITVQRTNIMHSNVTKHTETCDVTEDRIKTVPNNAAIEKSSNHISLTCTNVVSEGNQPPQSSKEKLPARSIPENKQHSNTVLTPIRTSPKGHNAMGQRQLSEVEDASEGKLLNDVGLSQTKALPVYKMTKLAMKDRTHNNQLLARDESVHTKQNAPLNLEQNSVSLVKELSRLLQKVDETDSLKSLREYKLTCKKIFPTVIKTFEKKQKCSYADVITDQKLLTNGNIKVAFKCVLKPCAIEAFIELQMMMETKQFIDNRIHYLQRQPTFRSLLWYDSSLYGELIAGESGYQQQTPLYRTFQEKLKLYPLDTLQNHYQQLSELLCGIHENRSSYYVFLKYRREIEECEAVLKNCCDLPEFSLSLPLTCGVHIGDTIDDLETLQKSTLELIKTYANSPRCDPGKREHALCLLEVISAKIIFIKTSESITMQLSLFGIEHLLFNAAKKLVLRQQSNYSEQKKLSSFTKEFMLTINHYALSKLYELYGTPNEEVMPVQIKDDLNNNSNRDLGFHPQHQMHYVGKIIDQARCAEPHQLKQMILDCREQLNVLIKYFQLLQECDADEVLITEKNVLEATKKQDQLVMLLKPEAVETYIEVGMMYETIHFLSSLLKKKQDRSRGLLFYDTSLFPNLLHSQHKIVSCLQGNLTSNALDVIESTISEIKSELEIICDCSESVNYTYALQIMTRELSELSELKNFVLESKPTISTYIPLSPFVVSVHYGSTLSELEYNYSQFSDLLGLLMSVPKKDLGRMAHTMKVMKTIELMKNIVLKSNKPAFNVIIYQLYKNNCEQDFIRERDKNSKMTDELSPRKRASSHTHPDKSDQQLDFSPKKQKVLKFLPSSSARDEHQILAGSPSRQREKMEDTVIRETADGENDTQDCTGRDPDCSSHKGDNNGEDSSSLQHNIQADLNERNSQSRIPSSSSNNHLESCAYPWQYSLYFWYQNGRNTSLVTQSYQGVSYNAQRSFPYGETPMFSAENSYAANQAYFPNQSQMCPMPGPFGIGTYYNYSAPPSQFPYDASPNTVWSWDSWQ